MLKKLLLTVITLIAAMGFAFAQVDANKADQAALDGVKGIGPVLSKKIIDERKKGGDFKDWADFEKRVKGVGEKNSTKLSQAGLTIAGRTKGDAPAAEAKPAKRTKPAQAAGSDSGNDNKASAADAKPSKLAKPAQAAGSDSSEGSKAAKHVKVKADKVSASASASATK